MVAMAQGFVSSGEAGFRAKLAIRRSVSWHIIGQRAFTPFAGFQGIRS
jgi:hypothetical protein